MKANLIKRGVAAAVFAGMLAATPCVANATTITDLPTITKYWEVKSATQFQKQDFTFTVKYDSYNSSNTSFTGKVQESGDNIQYGTWTKTETVSFSGTETEKSTKTYEASTQILSGLDFLEPGQYIFSVTEDDIEDNFNVVKDPSTFYVVVNVEWTDDNFTSTKINSIVYHKGAKTGTVNKTTGVVFTNTPAATPGDDSLKITKTVSGTAANTNDTFTYTLELSGLTGDYDVKTSANATIKKNGTDVTTVTNGSYTVTLKSGASISVVNLPEGACYSVTEEETDYKEFVTENSGDKASEVSDKVECRVATGYVDTDGATVAYTNKKGFAPDSGITMNTLPFIGVGAVAAAGAVTLVISRKRRAGEDF